MNRVYTVKQVADILGYSTNSIYTFLKEKRIKGVRVGKEGRFRIPQSELDRLLSLSKTTSSSTVSTPVDSSVVTQPSTDSSTVEVAPDPYIVASPTHEEDYGYRVPFVEWFVAMTSFVGGIALFLFSKSYGTLIFTPYMPWIYSIRLFLILSSLGMICVLLFSKHTLLWRTLYRTIILGCFIALSYIMFQTRDGDGLLLSSIFTVLLSSLYIFPAMAPVTGMVSVTVLLGIGGMVLLLIAPEMSVSYQPIVRYFSTSVLAICWGIGAVLSSVAFLWASRQRKSFLYYVLSIAFALIFMIFGGLYVWQLSWIRAFSCFMTAFFFLLLPYWKVFMKWNTRSIKILYVMFMSTLMLFVFVLITLFVYERTARVYVGKQLHAKAQNGGTYLDSVIFMMKRSFTTKERDYTDLVASIKKYDRAILTDISKREFEEQEYFRRVIVLNDVGKEIAHYPLSDATIKDKDFSYRPYFIDAVQKRDFVIVNAFENVQIPMQTSVTVSTPILDPKTQEVLGVLVGSLDLDLINKKLQTFGSSEIGESFAVLDEMGKRIIYHQMKFVGTSIPMNAINTHDFSTFLDERFNAEGVQSFHSYTKTENGRWIVVAMQSVYDVFHTSIVLFAVIGLLFFGIFFIIIIGSVYCGITCRRDRLEAGP